MRRIIWVARRLLFAVLPIVFCGSLAYSAQCLATTKKGTQCKRQAAVGVRFCWQHGGKSSIKAVPQPQQDDAYKTNTSTATKTAEANSTRCKAITKKGTQCKRQPEKGSQFCWQHGGKSAELDSEPPAEADSIKAKEAVKEKSPKKESGQCQAITKKGTRCKRVAQPGFKYCWQHGD